MGWHRCFLQPRQVSQMKRPVPEWLPQLVWFLAGIYATGALWYFLGKDDNIGAGLSMVGAFGMTLVAIALHRVNDRSSRFRAIRHALAAQVENATDLIQRQSEMPLPVTERNEWIADVERWLESNLDRSYVVRFGIFSGMTFYSDGSEKAAYRNSLDGRIWRLNEFIQEFRD